jgi:gliding motility-associated-like protein
MNEKSTTENLISASRVASSAMTSPPKAGVVSFRSLNRLLKTVSLIFLFALFCAPQSSAQVLINELGVAPSCTSCNAAGGGEFIELFNSGCASVNIGCYVIVWTGTSASSNPTGWTISIPAGTTIPSGGYYVIGGSGTSPGASWSNCAVGGSSWNNPAGTVNLDISTTYNSGLNSCRPGNLVDTYGQVTLLNGSGTAVTSMSYNAGNNPASYSGSFSQAPPGCSAINPINAQPNAANDVTGNFGSGGPKDHCIELHSDGNYYAVNTDGTPGSANPSQTPGSSGGPTALATTITNPKCGLNNGSVNIGATTGGTGPFTYSFNGSGYTATTTYSGMAAGTYTVIVKDKNGCIFSKTVTLTNTPGVSTTAGATTNINCRGSSTGTATISASAGTTPYAYNWTGGAIGSGQGTVTAGGLAAGTYTCTVTDASGCTSSKIFVLTQPATALSVSPNATTNVDCKGNSTGAGSVTASGGTIAYAYSWTGGTIGSGQGTNSVGGLAAGTYTCTVTDAKSCVASQTISITQPVASLSTVANAPTNVACKGGSTGAASVTVSGGTTAYAYNWTGGTIGSGQGTNSVSGLAAGTYTCSVTDARGCPSSQTVIVGQPALAISSSAGATTNVACKGSSTGAASVSASGGTPGYNYNWTGGTIGAGQGTNSVSGLAAGTYTCSITDTKGCPSSQTITITQPATGLSSLTGATSNIACKGGSSGSASVTASGGTPAYTYSWTGGTIGAGQGTNTASGLAAGTYTCSITDANNCPSSQVITLSQPAAVLSSSANAPTNIDCKGNSSGSASVTVSGGTIAYTYSWTGGTIGAGQGTASASSLAAGTYTCTISDAHACPSSQVITLTQPAAVLSSSTTASSNIACKGSSTGSASVSASGGTAAYTYSWTGGTIGAGQGTPSASSLAAGTYTCTINDAHNCASSQVITLTQPATGLSSVVGSTSNIACKGNSSGTAAVTASGGTIAYTYSWTGGTIGAGQGTNSVSGLAAGTYTCNITDANNCPSSQVITLTQPALVLTEVSNAPTVVACKGNSTGTASVTVSGGTAAYTYSWTGGTIGAGQGTNAVSGLAAGSYTCNVTDAHSCPSSQIITITEPVSALSSSTGATSNIACKGSATGSATVGASGGTPSYTYSWTGGAIGAGQGTVTASGLAAGTYTCSITDSKGCPSSQVITLTQPATGLSSIIASSTNIACFGGTGGAASVTASGGTAAYTYSWTGGTIGAGQGTNAVSGLAAGTYTCSIADSKGCPSSQVITLIQPASALAATPNAPVNVACKGGSTGTASVVVGGGTSAYTYSWTGGTIGSGQGTNTAGGLAAGTYTCTVTDAHSCSASQTITITQPASSLAVSSSSSTPTGCGAAAGTATVSVTGGTGADTYTWSPVPGGGQGTNTATGLSAGNYTVIIQDANSCQQSVVYNIVAAGGPSATIAGVAPTCNGSCNGSASVVASGGTGPYAYSWAPGGATTASINALCSNIYTCTITDASSCSTTQSVPVTAPASLAVIPASQSNVTCYGLSTGSASVSVTGGTTNYTYSWTGGTIGAGQGTNSISVIAAGNYTCSINDAKGCTTSQVFSITGPASSLSLAASGQTNILCAGNASGTASVIASGGTTAYTYSWSGGTIGSGQGTVTAGNLTAGTYTCIVTDKNGCTASQVFTLTEPAAALASGISSQTNINCYGSSTGAATVSVSGGTTSYTYSWSGGTISSGQGTASVSVLAGGTYTCLVTDANGCTSTTIVTLTQPLAPLSATPSQTDVACNGDITGAASVSVSGGTLNYSYSWSPSGGNASSAAGLGAGNYTCTITDANSCTLSQVFSISQSPAIVLSPSSVPAGCGLSNGSVSISASGGNGTYNYSWSPGGATIGTVNNLPAGNYTVIVTDGLGCNQQAVITLPNSGGPSSSITSVSNSTCNASCNGSATVSATGGTGTYTYSWSPVGGNAATASGLCAGTFTCTILDASNCLTSQQIILTDPAALSATTTQTNINCNGASTGSAAVTVSGGTGSYTYSWSPSGGTAASASGLAAGTYTCSIQDANACILMQVFTLTQHAPLAATTTVANVLCNGSSTGSIATVVSGGSGPGTYTYSWSPTGGNASSAQGLSASTYTCTITGSYGCTLVVNASVTEPAAIGIAMSQTPASCGNKNGSALASPSGGTGSYTFSWSPSGGTTASATNLAAGNYVCMVTDSNGCTASAGINVTQPNPPAASSTQTNVQCNGAANGSINVSVIGGKPVYTFSWSPSGGTGAVANGLAPGNYTCTVTDSLGCSTSVSATITEPALLNASITSNTNPSCNGSTNGSGTVTVAGGTAPYTYSWSPVAGAGAGISGLGAGTYTCTVTDAQSCSANITLSLIEPTTLTAGISVTNPTCGLNNGSAIANPAGGIAPYQYSWSPTGGLGNTATGLSAGTYTCTVTDANGCQVNQNAALTNTGIPVSAAINVSGPLVFCQGGTVILKASGGTSYSWTTGATTDSILVNTSGNYGVTVSNACGSKDTSINVTVTPLPLAKITGTTSICAGDSVLLTASGGTTFSWSNGMTTPSIYVSSTGTYTVTATNACGTSTSQITVHVNKVTVSCAADSTSGVAAFTVNFSSISSATVGTWSWNFGDSTTGSGSGISHTYTTSGTYTAQLTVTDTNGCSAKATVVINVSDVISWITIPNVFTPNGDGSNDLFIVNSQGLIDFSLQIFDRWGVKIAELVAPHEGWDGRTEAGMNVVNGTYYYILKAHASDNKDYNLTGFFMLIH